MTRQEYNKAYRQANKQRLSALQKEKYDEDITKSRELVRKRAARYRADHPEYEKLQSAKWVINNPEKNILRRVYQRAKKNKIEFTITHKDIIIPSHCPILGMKLIRGSRGSHDNSPSLDRIDNNKGYVKGNIQVISQRANTIKSYGTAEEHVRIAAHMLKNIC